jgi:hypothetical protein
MKTSKKLGLGVAMVVALFIGFATPAAAGGPYPLGVTSGTLTTTIGDFNLAPGSSGTPPCPEKAGTLALTTAASPNTWSVTGAFNGRFQFPAGSGNWYQADFTMLPGSGGSWSGTSSPYALTGSVGIQVRIYQLQLAGGPVNCAKTNLRCIITAAFSVTGSFTGTLPTAAVGDTAVISGTTAAPLVTSSCSPPWNSVGGTNATLTSLTMALT